MSGKVSHSFMRNLPPNKFRLSCTPSSSLARRSIHYVARVQGALMPSSDESRVALPSHWANSVQAALLQIIALAQHAFMHTCGWAANSTSPSTRAASARYRDQQEIAFQREEIRI